MYQDDSQTGRFAAAEEVPGLNAFLSAQSPVTEAEIDSMFVAEMQRRDAEAAMREHERSVAAFAA